MNAMPQPREALHVLLVEDEPCIAEMVAEALDIAGFCVVARARGEDALRLLREGARVDILFTDINLAGEMNGWQLAQACRELVPGLPIVYTSAAAGADTHERVSQSTFVPKPYSPFRVSRLLREFSGSSAVAAPPLAPALHPAAAVIAPRVPAHPT